MLSIGEFTAKKMGWQKNIFWNFPVIMPTRSRGRGRKKTARAASEPGGEKDSLLSVGD